MAANPSLTRKQQSLLSEIEAISELFGLDYTNIRDYVPESRTPMLEAMKNKLVRGQVIIWYTLVDEFLNMEICHYYFGKKRDFPQLWRTKRFQLFNHYILEELYPLQKLRFVKEVRAIPKDISQNIELLNVLRNGLAHAFFPENSRKMKPSWKGKNIFTLEGAEGFMSDMQEVSDFFLGPKSKKRSKAPPNHSLKRDALKRAP